MRELNTCILYVTVDDGVSCFGDGVGFVFLLFSFSLAFSFLSFGVFFGFSVVCGCFVVSAGFSVFVSEI